jgi:hypothetical protein
MEERIPTVVIGKEFADAILEDGVVVVECPECKQANEVDPDRDNFVVCRYCKVTFKVVNKAF